jgi:hypothetical protein
MNTKLLALISLLLAGALGYLLFTTSADRRRAEAELAEARALLEQLQSQLNDLNSAQTTATDLARLKADQRDAIKLRGEISTLKQSLATAQKAAADARRSNPTAAKPAAETEATLVIEPLPENNPEALVHKTKLLTSQLKPGDAMVLGGWRGASGKRIFALVQPSRIDATGNVINGDAAQIAPVTQQVAVTSKWVELPETAAAKLGLGQDLVNMTGEETAIIHGDAYADWLKQIEASEGIDIMTAPTVTTLSGRQARLAVTESHPTAQGPVEFGPKLDIISTISDNGHINVSLQASLTESPKPPAK